MKEPIIAKNIYTININLFLNHLGSCLEIIKSYIVAYKLYAISYVLHDEMS